MSQLPELPEPYSLYPEVFPPEKLRQYGELCRQQGRREVFREVLTSLDSKNHPRAADLVLLLSEREPINAEHS